MIIVLLTRSKMVLQSQLKLVFLFKRKNIVNLCFDYEGLFDGDLSQS